MDSHLAVAAEVGDVSKVIQLLRAGADVNSQGGLNGETALIEAAYTGDLCLHKTSLQLASWDNCFWHKIARKSHKLHSAECFQ